MKGLLAVGSECFAFIGLLVPSLSLVCFLWLALLQPLHELDLSGMVKIMRRNSYNRFTKSPLAPRNHPTEQAGREEPDLIHQAVVNRAQQSHICLESLDRRFLRSFEE